MLSVATALQEILRRARPSGSERVPLAQAPGRILRAAAVADGDLPPFDAAAMDGYALRRADAGGPLTVIGTSQAGAGCDRTVGTGECVRIFTGAMVPPGADCVVRQEDVQRTGESVRVMRLDPATYIRRRGENRRRGEVVVPAGVRLGPVELAALASVGGATPEVAVRPRCVHLVTGDELVAPDEAPAEGQIRDSNSTLVRALVERSGGVLTARQPVPDELADALARARELPEHDILLISGGASVGDRDHAAAMLGELGYDVHFRALDLRPGKPTIFASRGHQLALALPGNPVSHWVVFQLLIAPLLEFLQTGQPPSPARLRARLAEGARLPRPDARATYWPSKLIFRDGRPEVRPLPLMSSGDATGLVGANALLPIAAGDAGLAPGGEVEIISCP